MFCSSYNFAPCRHDDALSCLRFFASMGRVDHRFTPSFAPMWRLSEATLCCPTGCFRRSPGAKFTRTRWVAMVAPASCIDFQGGSRKVHVLLSAHACSHEQGCGKRGTTCTRAFGSPPFRPLIGRCDFADCALLSGRPQLFLVSGVSVSN